MAHKLRPAVARKYETTGHARILRPNGQVIDLRKLTVKQADALVKAGNFPYLQLIKKV